VLRSRRGVRPPDRPGWYPDGSGWLRYFDGHGWTEQLRERLVLAPFHGRLPDPERPPRALVRRRPGAALRVASVLLACVLLGGVVLQLVAFDLAPHGVQGPLTHAEVRSLAAQACAPSIAPSAIRADRSDARSRAAARASSLTELSAEEGGARIHPLAVAWSALAVAMAAHPPSRAALAREVAVVDRAARAVGVAACGV